MNPTDISLYAILDPARSKGRPLADLAAQAADGGATIFQYRDKTGDTRTMLANARAIIEALNPFNVPLLINDRVDIALASGAQGVHVGQSDMPARDARRLLGPDAIIGLTIKEMQHVHEAPLEVLDYACMGGVFDTLSKDNPRAIGIDGWQELAQPFRAKMPALPVGAIAGIDHSNAAEVIEAGADGVAVISALFMADDVRRATEELKEIIEGARP
ncbi:thiamine phosphate synthase [Pseudahrensia aquimaris]|uniref:Thiamine-phosphate synthase n=1 Tax=Pseudahrensia aquimaris TaxID=744461 RepID=A0ABW3FDP5_9HYPH